MPRRFQRPGQKQRAARIDLTIRRPPLEFRWASAILEEEWESYRRAMDAVRKAGVQFLLGGGFALAAYAGRWRDTKDIDFYIRQGDRDAAVAALEESGFKDYYDQVPYDRNWIHRSVRRGVIVDLIWAMANQRAQVDDAWFAHAGPLTLRNQQLRVIAPEEFVWCKLYIMQRDHCDWTDIFNLLYACGPEVDWPRLIRLVGEDVQLLRAMLTAYSWLCPNKVLQLPLSIWRQLKIPAPPRKPPRLKFDRVRLLDSRHWFVGSEPEGRKLEV